MEMDLKRVCVRPVRSGEEFRYRELMQAHHYLGDLAKIGHTLWYVATYEQSATPCTPAQRLRSSWDRRHPLPRYSSGFGNRCESLGP